MKRSGRAVEKGEGKKTGEDEEEKISTIKRNPNSR